LTEYLNELQVLETRLGSEMERVKRKLSRQLPEQKQEVLGRDKRGDPIHQGDWVELCEPQGNQSAVGVAVSLTKDGRLINIQTQNAKEDFLRRKDCNLQLASKGLAASLRVDHCVVFFIWTKRKFAHSLVTRVKGQSVRIQKDQGCAEYWLNQIWLRLRDWQFPSHQDGLQDVDVKNLVKEDLSFSKISHSSSSVYLPCFFLNFLPFFL